MTDRATVAAWVQRRVVGYGTVALSRGDVIVTADEARDVAAALELLFAARPARRHALLELQAALSIVAAHETTAAVPMSEPVSGHRNDNDRPILDDPPRVTTAIAARELGCTDRYVRRLLADGTLSGARAGPRCWLVDVESLERLRRQRASA